MPSQPIFRFAPSPNGYLHLGHAYSALFTWRAAAAAGGTALLRIEDIDTRRCKPEFDAAIREDLRWLGLDWPEPLMRQSERFPAYAKAAKALTDRGLLYPCFCSRTEIAATAKATDPDGAPLYAGTCRNLPPAEVRARLAAGEPAQWRLRTNEALASVARPLVIREAPVFGNDVDWSAERERLAEPELWGDVVLVRKETPTSYHLSVVVDDAAQGVTYVTRGMDLHAATGIHVLLQSVLDLASPAYAHHRLVTGTEETKLAKSANATPLHALRASGWSPSAVRDAVGIQ